MEFVSRATPLYEFLRICNNAKLERKVLDCGAGGSQPPLYIFYQFGYQTFGIDISNYAINSAEEFCKKHGINLNIKLGDMRSLEFEDSFFPFIFSYNTINHLSKKDIIKTIQEMERILQPKGLFFVNFGSEDSEIGNRGEKVGDGEYLVPIDNDETALHSFHTDDEADEYFANFEMIHKQKRLINYYKNGKKEFVVGYIDYIVKKL